MSNGVMRNKRFPLNMRTTRELRSKIEEAAKSSGRSLVQEVEYRVEQSFSREDTETMLRRVLKEQAELHYATRNYPGAQSNGFPRL